MDDMKKLEEVVEGSMHLDNTNPQKVIQSILDAGYQITEGWRPIAELVNKQADAEGLWFQAQTAPEAYLQQELRKLHAVIEGTDDFGQPLPTPPEGE